MEAERSTLTWCRCTPPEADKRRLEKRWSKQVLEPGFTFVPSVILRAQARLHIDAVELTVLHLIDHWWDDGTRPFPSKKCLAERLGVSDKTIQRAMKRLKEDGLIRREARTQASGGAGQQPL